MDYLSLEHHYEEIPAKQQHRRCTDIVCTILSIVFVLGLFTYALIAFIINSNIKGIQWKILQLI